MKVVKCYLSEPPFGRQKNPIARFVLTTIFISILFLNNASAEEPQRGRLADGRAFRTDDQGNQLVDYIAELEVNVEALERQVQGLEDENKEKQVIISRLQKGEKAEGNLIERNINSQSDKARTQSQECNVSSDCSVKIKEYEQQIDDLKVDHQVTLMEQKKEIGSLRDQLKEYENQLVSLKDELKNEQSQKENYETRIAQLQEQIQQPFNRDSASSAVNSSENNNSRAALKVESLNREQGINSTGLKETRIQAVDMLRSRMLTDLNSLQGLVSHRDNLTQEAQRRGISVGTSSKSANELRQSIARYRTQINSATKVHELSSIRGAINELRGSIQSEIANLKRLTKSR